MRWPDLLAVNQASGTVTLLLSTLPTPPPPPPAVQIVLTVSTRIAAGTRLVDLRWTGATTSKIDVYRNSSRIATSSNTGSYSDRFNRQTHGTFTYRVCNAGSGACSNQATVTF